MNAGKIEAAYGQEWKRVKRFTNANGWCRLPAQDFPQIEKEYNRHKIYWWRPVELSKETQLNARGGTQ